MVPPMSVNDPKQTFAAGKWGVRFAPNSAVAPEWTGAAKRKLILLTSEVQNVRVGAERTFCNKPR
jgi:hypothetical protein